ncbi:hypothetical protein V6N12_027268 [Hibiscus sabdariffa]|uniref:Uncharacterized protein n=1 Tax=Hibiscus sabdariffa TaxID=183260 RepID=A0ABR2DU80_9ROSI
MGFKTGAWVTSSAMLTASNSSSSSSSNTKEEALLVAAKETLFTFKLVLSCNEKLKEALKGGNLCRLGRERMGFVGGRRSRGDGSAIFCSCVEVFLRF